MTVSLKQAVARETAIGIAINLILVSLITWLALPKVEIMPLFDGPASAGFGLIPASVLFPLGASLLLGMGIRKQVMTGKIKAAGYQGNALLKMLPASLVIRSILFAVVFGAVIAPLTLAIVAAAGATEWSYAGGFALNLVYMIFLTLIMMPLIVRSTAYYTVKSDLTSDV